MNKNIHLEIGYSQILDVGDWSTEPVGRENDKGGILKLESKFIVSQKNHFISLKKYRTWHDYESIRYLDINSTDLVKYNVNSRVFGIIPQYGFLSLENRFHFEVSVGYGLRILNIKNDYPGNIYNLSRSYRINERFEPEQNGTYYRGSIALNFKIGYCF
ncbi:MAG TPA: hypothetical protein PKD18_07395 [Saprospiraceae bacterium]|nr:hypothetical protein [Saprospiraceae bacterium]